MTTTLPDEMCVQPIIDTWQIWDDAGSWTWSPRAPWSAAQLPDVLEALRPFARVREALIGGPPDAPPIATPERVWTAGLAHDAFERSLIDAALNEPVPITTIDLVVDLLVWVRTATSPTVPVLGWLSRGAVVALYFGRSSPNGTLHIHHTLFIDGDLAGDSNAELHQLNQPRLRDALSAIESRFGPITEFAGLLGINRSGFASIAQQPAASLE
jgi:hypothetical protein